MRNLHFMICLLSIASCKSPAERRVDILHDFDSINKQLDSLNKRVWTTDDLYDSLLQAASDSGGVNQQLYYKLNDFHGYMSSCLYNFYGFAGDTTGEKLFRENEDNFELVPLFVKRKPYRPENISAYLQGAMDDLRPFAKDTAILKRITAFRDDVSSARLKKTLEYIPPVAFTTLIRYYDHQVKTIELDILKGLVSR